MEKADIPAKFGLAFGANAVPPYIRTVPEDPPIESGAASLSLGFPPETQTPISAGGTPPFGADMNGILNLISAWVQWQAAGGTVEYDATFATAVGGYPKDTILLGEIPGSRWISTVDNNITDPDDGGANWSPFGPSTGDAKITLKSIADYGWLIMNDGTIGSATSGATLYAAAVAEDLFSLIWNNVSNTWAAIQDSAGAASTRGASAAADFALDKRMPLPKQLGRALAIAGTGSGLTNHVLGQIAGAESQVIAQANLPAVTLNTAIASGQGSHTHTSDATTQSGAQGSAGAGGRFTTGTAAIDAATLPAMTGTTPLGGAGTALPTIPPEAFWNVMIKL